MIDFSFTEEQVSKRKEIVAFSEKHFNKQVALRDEREEFDRNLWKRAGELLLPGLAVPETYGGAGLDEISTMVALEALGYGCEDNGLSFAIGAHLLSCVVPIALYGTSDQKEMLLPSLCNGTCIAANAMTELTNGSDVFDMETTVAQSNDGYLLSGDKAYVSNAPVADYVITYATSDKEKGSMGGVSCLILDKTKFDTSEQIPKMGLKTCLMGKISFKQTSISERDFLGKPGAGTIIFSSSMAWERIGFSALHLGTLQRLLDKAYLFVKQKRENGKSLSNYQAITHELASIKASLTAARWATYYASWCLAHKEKTALYASVAKLSASETYKKSCQSLLQVYGAMGYIDNHEIERTVRDSMASTLYSGTSEIQKNIIFNSLNNRGL